MMKPFHIILVPLLLAGCGADMRVPLDGPVPRVGLIEQVEWIAGREFADEGAEEAAMRELRQEWRLLLAQIVDHPSYPELATVMERNPWSVFLLLSTVGRDEGLAADIDPDFTYDGLRYAPGRHRGRVVGINAHVLRDTCWKVRLGEWTTVKLHESLIVGQGPAGGTEYYLFQWVEREYEPFDLMEEAFVSGRFFKNRPLRGEAGAITWIPVIIGPPPQRPERRLGRIAGRFARRELLSPFRGLEPFSGEPVDTRPVVDVGPQGHMRLNGQTVTGAELETQLAQRARTGGKIPAVVLRLDPEARRTGAARDVYQRLKDAPVKAIIEEPGIHQVPFTDEMVSNTR